MHAMQQRNEIAGREIRALLLLWLPHPVQEKAALGKRSLH
jgi:hypothetical protein